jgi:hypothetical protein
VLYVVNKSMFSKAKAVLLHTTKALEERGGIAPIHSRSQH